MRIDPDDGITTTCEACDADLAVAASVACPWCETNPLCPGCECPECDGGPDYPVDDEEHEW